VLITETFMREHFDDMRGHISAWWINHGSKVRKWKLVQHLSNVVRVKRAPSPLLRHHTLRPSDRPLDRGVDLPTIDSGHTAKGEDNFSRVVHVGIVVVRKLKCPPTDWELGTTNCPIAPNLHLFAEEPFCRADHRGVVRCDSRVCERDGCERRVPNR